MTNQDYMKRALELAKKRWDILPRIRWSAAWL